MNYGELAQRIVSQGIGQPDNTSKSDWYWVPNSMEGDEPYTAEQFCNDGRVVLALMEKCYDIWWHHDRDENQYYVGASAIGTVGEKAAIDDSLAIAIVLACLEALEKDDG